MVTDYYDAYFHGFDGYDPVQRETLRKTLIAAEKRKGTWGAGGHACFGAESGRQNSDVGRTEESVESDILVVQHFL